MLTIPRTLALSMFRGSCVMKSTRGEASGVITNLMSKISLKKMFQKEILKDAVKHSKK